MIKTAGLLASAMIGQGHKKGKKRGELVDLRKRKEGEGKRVKCESLPRGEPPAVSTSVPSLENSGRSQMRLLTPLPFLAWFSPL